MKLKYVIISLLFSVLLMSSCRKDGKEYSLKTEILSPFNNANGVPFYWHGTSLKEWHTTVDESGAVQTSKVYHPNLPMRLLFAKENMRIIESGTVELANYYATNEDFIQIYNDAFFESVNPVNMYVDYKVTGTFTNSSTAPSELSTDEKNLINTFGSGNTERLTLNLEYEIDHQNSWQVTTVNKKFTFIRAIPNGFSSSSTTITKFE